MCTKVKRDQGFSLIELLIVVVVIAVLTAVLAPAYVAQVEKSRNAVDLQNAKAIADAVNIYFIDHPAEFAEFAKQCDIAPHDVQVSVANQNAAIATVLRPALNQAGLIGSYGTGSAERYDITCKSRTKWNGYRVVFSTYAGVVGQPGELKTYFWGIPVGSTVHGAHALSYYQTPGTDPTGFQDAMSGIW